MTRYDEGSSGEWRIHPAIWGLGLCIPAVVSGLPLLAALPAAVFAYRAVERGARKSLLDEGGVRFDRFGGLAHCYLPFAAIARVRIDDTSVTAMNDRGEPIEQWKLGDLAQRSELYVELSERVGALETCENPGFERSGRSLEEWCSALDSMAAAAERNGPYRAGRVDLERAHSLLSNVNLPIDVRAGAAYLLSKSRNPRHAEEIRAILSSSSPPLVSCLAFLASRADDLRVLATPAVRYLEPADRAAWKTLQR